MLALAHAAATLYMTGLIWFVQLVHYPLMAKVGPANYKDYQQAHMSLTSLAVGPAMLLEALTTILLLKQSRTPLTIAAALLLALIWLSTFLLQIPQHNALTAGFNADAHQTLVATNWVRTLAWTARAALALALLRK